METPKPTLINPTLDELSEAVAEHVAHAIPPKDDDYFWAFKENDGYTYRHLPSYATSAGEVLPLLEKYPYVSINRIAGDGWQVSIIDHKELDVGYEEGVLAEAWEDTLALAACIALLRTNGIEVNFSRENR